jgi:radical SAM protein with 4Fe4S-binding SPASM domain
MPRAAKLPTFVLEWRMAPHCRLACPACNMIDTSSKNEEQENQLHLEECIPIVENFYRMIKDWRFHGVIRISGGNYRETDDFLKLIKYIRDKDIDIDVMGCPRHLKPLLPQLKELHIKRVSLFLYGIGEKHDAFRCENDFSETLELYRECRNYHIPARMVFLVNKNFYNHPEDLEEIARLILDEKILRFEFKRFPYIYNSPQFKLTGQEFYTVMFHIFRQYMRHLRDFIGEEDMTEQESLWALLFQALGMHYHQPEEEGLIHSGCRVGSGKIAVRADGIVYPCLTLPVKVGKVPEESLQRIFIDSDVINRMRSIDDFAACKACDLARVCRGCPGMAYQDSKDYLARDPYCWKEFKMPKK